MRVHLVGVGGVGMAGLAVLLKSRGHDVSGCDLHASPRTRWLESEGVRFSEGHSVDHLDGIDMVVVTPAVPSDSPELACARRKGLRVRARGEVLAELVNESDAVAVCGSHGKTTTATWTAKLLLALGEDVAWCIGGETDGFPVAHAASGPLVVEADESDGTLALYRAKTLVVTNCEYDHPDHFKTPEAYFACYDAARSQAGRVVEGGGLPSLGLEADACLEPLAPHNRKNARAAIEVALLRGHPLDRILAALPQVVDRLPDRRFQRIYPVHADQPGNLLVVADYAHPPTEMACAVGMARKACRGTLRVLFQPHRYSRTKALLGGFPAAFAEADEVVLCPTYAAFERPVEGGDVADLYAACRAAGTVKGLFLARSCAEAWEHACNSMADGDVTLLLGAGDIIDLAPVVRETAGRPRGATRRIWIGAGSNTWKSDLNLSVEYVRTAGPAGAPGASLGIPWMAGIPGTVGGWIKMNAGAFGHSISDALEAVKVDGRWVDAADCGFSYRHSRIEGEIQDFRLRPDIPDGDASAEAYLSRRLRFPPGTYGSFFKNPPGDSAGRLLESVGAKGMRVGGAYVWEGHANVIVRGDGATASDVLALAQIVRNRVLFRLGVALEPEVCGVA